MTERRARGEALALVLKCLREHRHGLSAKEVAAKTGIAQVLCGVLLANYRGAGHVESTGHRLCVRWYVAGGAPSSAAPQLVTPLAPRSIFAPVTAAVSPSFALGSSRVMHEHEGCVKADDFSQGAFMRDWRARTSGADVA